VVLRSYLRQRQMLIRYAGQHVQHMQKAFEQMNVKLAEVVSDITGVTGMAIIRAILAGERDPRLYKRGQIVGYQPGGPRTRIVFSADTLEQLAGVMPRTPISTTGTPSESKTTPQRGPRPKWLDASEAEPS
jgi:hypothetical protein